MKYFTKSFLCYQQRNKSLSRRLQIARNEAHSCYNPDFLYKGLPQEIYILYYTEHTLSHYWFYDPVMSLPVWDGVRNNFKYWDR